MIRWLVSLWRGPLCDAGTALGGPGCLKPGTHTTLVFPPGWSRGFRWCEEHKGEAGRATGIGQPPVAPSREGALHKGGQNLTYQIAARPPDPPPMRRPATALTDNQVLDADADLLDAEIQAKALMQDASETVSLREENARLREALDTLIELGDLFFGHVHDGIADVALAQARLALAPATTKEP